jgi:hypothetical protein
MDAERQESPDTSTGIITPTSAIVFLGIDDADHYTDEMKAELLTRYPAHERKARLYGIPQLGSGAVYPLPEDSIRTDTVPIPAHWPRLAAIDFGWDHPTAAVEIAWDREADCVYVTKAYRVAQRPVAMHAIALKPWGDWLPWAWPHDGLQHDKGSGEQLAAQYRNQGLKMLPMRATFEDGSFGVEAGIAEMYDRMQTGRLKVFSHLAQWFEEFNLYHRVDGLIVKKADDLMAATRYAIMMRRFANTQSRQAPATNLQGRGRASWMS